MKKKHIYIGIFFLFLAFAFILFTEHTFTKKKADSVFVDMIPLEDTVWHVDYINCYGAPSAPDDGSIGLWADGWFIAHSNMPNGDIIASLPEKIEVDGKIYHYESHWIADDYLDRAEVIRVRANGGLAFQTCITEDLNLMVHYEPDGEPYGYEWSRWPYTVNDGSYIGYYPLIYFTEIFH